MTLQSLMTADVHYICSSCASCLSNSSTFMIMSSHCQDSFIATHLQELSSY